MGVERSDFTAEGSRGAVIDETHEGLQNLQEDTSKSPPERSFQVRVMDPKKILEDRRISESAARLELGKALPPLEFNTAYRLPWDVRLGSDTVRGEDRFVITLRKSQQGQHTFDIAVTWYVRIGGRDIAVREMVHMVGILCRKETRDTYRFSLDLRKIAGTIEEWMIARHFSASVLNENQMSEAKKYADEKYASATVTQMTSSDALSLLNGRQAFLEERGSVGEHSVTAIIPTDNNQLSRVVFPKHFTDKQRDDYLRWIVRWYNLQTYYSNAYHKNHVYAVPK